MDDKKDEQQETYLTSAPPEEDNVMFSSEDGLNDPTATDDVMDTNDDSYQEKESNTMRHILLGVLAIVVIGFIGFFVAGEQIIHMIDKKETARITPIALQKRQKELESTVNNTIADDRVDNAALGEPPAMPLMDENQVLSDGSFTSIEEPENTEQDLSSDTGDILTENNPLQGNQQDMLQYDGMDSTTDNENGVVAEVDSVSSPDLPDAPLESAPEDFDEEAVLENVLGGEDILEPAPPLEMDPDLKAILAGRNVPGNISSGGYESQSAADMVRESITVHPRVKKMIIVEKDYASSSDRSIAAAGARALRSGQYMAAIRHYNTVLQNDPGNVTAMMGKALAFQKNGNTEEALDAYSAIIEHDPNNVNALTNYFGLISKIDPQTAIEELKVMQQQSPGNPAIAGQLGVVYGKMKDPVNAAIAFNTAASLDPKNPLYVYNMAVLADKMGARGKAIKYYEQTLDLLNEKETSRISRESIFARLHQLRRP